MPVQAHSGKMKEEALEHFISVSFMLQPPVLLAGLFQLQMRMILLTELQMLLTELRMILILLTELQLLTELFQLIKAHLAELESEKARLTKAVSTAAHEAVILVSCASHMGKRLQCSFNLVSHM